SDAVHSFSDVFTTLIALVGVKVSGKVADERHPYGHERMECVASLVLGIILMLTAFGIGWAGISAIVTGSYEITEHPGYFALCAAVISIVGKELMCRYTLNRANKINSSAFIADAMHHRSDALSSIGSLIGIGFSMLGFPIMDSVASLAICVFIARTAVIILKNALSGMLDTSCSEGYEEQLASCISSHADVVSVDMLQSRMFGNKIYVDLEIGVDGNSSLRQAHAIAERVHSDVERDFPDIKHVMIHVNPAETSKCA
ncbi:MAG: cation diffusion facilitator family transporter, partial [Clostridiales bacterium]|nr:cation diffusion facilitator family transporter [Clostridiales bacterium]